MPSSFDRIVRPDRPVATILALVGVGFLVCVLAGLVAGLLADDFRSTLGWTVAVGMVMTAVVSIVLVTVATVRRK